MLKERMKQWEQELLDQGREKGQISILERMLVMKFGTLPDWATDKLQNATSADIECWAEKILVANNLEDVL